MRALRQHKLDSALTTVIFTPPWRVEEFEAMRMRIAADRVCEQLLSHEPFTPAQAEEEAKVLEAEEAKQAKILEQIKERMKAKRLENKRLRDAKKRKEAKELEGGDKGKVARKTKKNQVTEIPAASLWSNVE